MSIRFKTDLIPAVVQDRTSGEVLMVGYMKQDAYRKTTETGRVTFYSRSRRKLWTKGESSGHWLKVREIRIDCDEDTLLALVDLQGPGTCHLGYRSCFFRKMTPEGAEVIAPRVFEPEKVYDKPASKGEPI